jgi:cation diffusion facilitator family transporter
MSGRHPHHHEHGAGGGDGSLTRFAWLSILAALTTMALKTLAWWVTGSVGLLSDAMESVVNLVAAVVALVALRVASQPADEHHAFGHGKAEYFSAGVEGALILVAAASIAWAAVERLLDPRELESVGVGLGVSVVAAALNGVVAMVLLRTGRRHRSIALEADGRHLFTDVWTSAGVLVGVGLVSMTGWVVLDPLVALAVAANIVVAGVLLVRRSVEGLMDVGLGELDVATIDGALDRFRADGVVFHALRTRQAGQQRFVSLHVLVPGAWTVQRGHDLLEQIEASVRGALPGVVIDTHLEPVEDPVSWRDGGSPPA